MNEISGKIPIINHNVFSPNFIKNGDSVFVRVLEKTEGQNQFLVNILGQKFQIKSSVPLQAGQTFRAQAVIENNFLKLVIENQNVIFTQNEDFLKKINSKDAQNSEQLKMLLENLGLTNDQVTFSLIQFFMQNKMKILPEKIRKAKSAGNQVAKKSEKIKQEEASQIELALELKNMDERDETILEFFENCNPKQNQHFQNESDKNQQNEKSLENQKNESFISKIYENENCINQNAGILTAFNHIKIKNCTMHVVILPFSFMENCGKIRLFINHAEKKTEKILIDYESKTKKYFFKITQDKKISFFVLENGENYSKSKYESIIKQMREFFPNFQIEIDENLAENSIFTENGEITILSEQA